MADIESTYLAEKPLPLPYPLSMTRLGCAMQCEKALACVMHCCIEACDGWNAPSDLLFVNCGGKLRSAYSFWDACVGDAFVEAPE